MALSCPSCRVPFRPEDLELARSIARCGRCASVMELGSDGGAVTPGRAAGLELRSRVPMPERFTDLEEPGRYTISWSWFTPQLILMLFFCIAWDSFLFVWYGRAFGEGNTDLMAVLFPIAHVAVGIGITYSTLAGLLNRTTIETNRQRLIVRHGPVPWPGTDLPLDSIAQLYCQAREVSRKNSSTTYYDVCALLKDGTKKRLLNRFTELDQALFVEQRLERAMRITDARVPGDIRVA